MGKKNNPLGESPATHLLASRSQVVWAPAHKNFLVKILAPPFDSSQNRTKEKASRESEVFSFVDPGGIEPPSIGCKPIALPLS
jgi:hypothetical protein